MSAGSLPCLSLPALLPLSALLLVHSYALSPPQFTTVPVDQIGVSGAVVSFVCQATGDPKPQVSWRKKGKKVNSKRINIIPFDEGAGTVLRIDPLRALQDQNTYECVAENSEGVVSVSANLSVITEDSLPTGFPNIYLGPQLKVVELTRATVLLCAARGNPDPKITWFKDFLPIDLNASHGRIKQLHSGALQINNSEETDQGKYECVASNVEGVHYSLPANLYVRIRRMPPHFTILPTSHEITAGGSVNITCVAVGSPMPYVKWMLNSEDLTPEDETPLGRNVLVLNRVWESANYTCVAMSSLGIIEAVAQITVTSQPKTREQAPSSPPRNVQARIISANTMMVRWDQPEEPNGQINGYRVYYTMDPSQDMSHWQIHNVQNSTVTTIQSLVISETYTIHVLAFTSVGDGHFSDPIHVKVLQGVLGQPTISPGPESEPHTDLIARFMSFLGLG